MMIEWPINGANVGHNIDSNVMGIMHGFHISAAEWLPISSISTDLYCMIVHGIPYALKDQMHEYYTAHSLVTLRCEHTGVSPSQNPSSLHVR